MDPTNTKDATRREGSALERQVRPCAWWVPLWPRAEPLYDQAALDAAVAAERERCATVAALHSQYPVTTEYDKGYAKARADAAAAIRRA